MTEPLDDSPFGDIALQNSIRPMHFRTSFFAALAAMLLLLCMSAAEAATYYVSNQGNDSAAGTSQATAWQTAGKVNSYSLQPGDQVLFQCGGKWYESLNPQSSGAAGNPITFATYGSGSKPLFSGGLTLPNSGFTYVGSSVWQISVATQINEVYINKVALIPANPNANQQVAAIPNSWFWSNGVLQINDSTNPNTDGKLYEGAVRQDIIANGNPVTYFGTSHLVFSNLAVEESGQIDYGYGLRIQNGTDVTLNNIESYRCGKHNFGAINSTQITFNGCLAEYPMPGEQSSGGYTAYVSYGDNSTNLPNQTSVYNNCVGDHMEDTTPGQQYEDTNYEFFTTHGSNIGSVMLNNCQAFSSSAGGAGAHWTISNQDAPNAIVQIHGGYLQNNQLVMTGTNLLVDGLTMQGPGPTTTNDATATIDMACSNSTVQNVLMENLNIGSWVYQAAILDEGTNNTIRFNTIVNDPSSYDNSVYNRENSLSLYGNIFVNPGTALGGNVPATNVDNPSFATAAGAGFVNPSGGNYTLSASSPARDVVPLSVAYPTKDQLGTARPDGSANDAGAYTYGSSGSGPSPPAINSASTATGTVGTAFSYQIKASNTPTSYGATGLPAGLSVSTTTGLISGTPTAAGTSTVTLSATNAGGTGTAALTITVSAAAATEAPYGGTAWAIPGKVEAENYDVGGEGVAYHDADPQNQGGAYRTDGVDIRTVTSDTGGGYQVGWTNQGEYLNYTVNVTAAGTYQFQARVASGSSGGSLHFSVDGTNVTGAMAVPGTGSYDTFTTISSGNVTLTAGKHIIQLYEDADNGYDINWFSVTTVAPAETPYGGTAWSIPGQIEAENYDVGGEGVAYHDADPQNQGGAYRTDGVDIRTVTSDTGGGYQVGWTNQGEYLNYTVNVTAAGTYQFQARVASGSSGGSLHFSVDGTNVTGAMAVPGTGSYDTFTTISSGNVTLTAGKHIIQLYEDADNGYDINWFSVTAAPPVVNSATSATGTVGTAFSYQITATNTPTSYGATGLPAGLSVSTTTGLISGTPTAAGTSTVTLSATNAGGTGTATLTITVSAAPATAYNVYALWTPGTTITNGGADSYGNGYNQSLVGTSLTFDGSTFTLGAANATDAWSNVTVLLPAGTYTKLDMVGSAVGGTVTNQSFVVTYTDSTTQTFTQSLSDWGSTQGYGGETVVNHQTTRLASTGASASIPTYIYGYTFTLNGKSVKSITLPATRQVIAFGFKGHN